MKQRNPAAITRNRANERRKWYLQESNRGHTDFQSDALPTELRHHVVSAFLSFCGCKGTKKK